MMTEDLPRRGFLRHLAALPLIGGSVTLLGKPTAVAAPVTTDLLEGYKTWLSYEHRLLTHELAARSEYTSYYKGWTHEQIVRKTEGNHWFETCAGNWHFADTSDPDRKKPSTRAALILSAAGVNWRGR